MLDQKIYNKIKKHTLKNVRGTVQADILKEDQAQNTCIFSTEFALKMMGDVQQYFIDNQIKKTFTLFQFQDTILLRQELIQLHN